MSTDDYEDIPGEEWKAEERTYKMSTVIELEKPLLRAVIRSDGRIACLEEIIQTFRPKGTSPKAWRNSCYNQAIEYWVNSDPVFDSFYGRKKPSGSFQRIINAFYGGIHYATMNGWWPSEVCKEADRIESEGENRLRQDNDDGA